MFCALCRISLNWMMLASEQVGRYMMEGIRRLCHPGIAEVRGAGLFIGVDFVKDPSTREPDGGTALALVNALRRRRVLISASGPLGHALKIRPPLPFTTAHADRFLAALRDCLEELN